MFYPNLHEIWLRLFGIGFIFIFSLMVNYFYLKEKSSEYELKESKEQFQNIYDLSPIGITIIQDNEIKYVNQTALDYTGYSKKEVLSWDYEKLLELIYPKDRDFIASQLKKKQERDPDQKLHYSYRSITKHGEIIWLDNFSKTIQYHGKPADLIISVDITTKKETQRQIKETANKYRELFNNIRSGVAIFRPINEGSDFKFVDLNLAGAKIAEINKDQVLNTKVTKSFPGIEKFGLFEVMQRVCNTGQSEHHPISLYQDERLQGWRDCYIYKLPSDEVVVVYEDVTREKEQEQYLKNSYEKIRFYKDLLSHDMGNILNNIKASIQLLEMWGQDKENSEKPEKGTEVIEILKEQVDLGANLIKDVRNLTSTEREEVNLKSLNLKPLIEDAVHYIKKFFQRKRIHIQRSYPQNAIYIKGTNSLNKAFENILMNSVIHNESDPVEIWINIEEIDTEQKSSLVKLEILDNGVGISEARKEIIFKGDYKEASTKGGMSIGLSLVKEIIAECRGIIKVKNRVKDDYTQGSNFIVFLRKA